VKGIRNRDGEEKIDMKKIYYREKKRREEGGDPRRDL
jgi:hypothetical protein